MLTVALETSHRSASVAVARGERVLERLLDPEQAHASDCLAQVAEMLDELDARPADILRVLVGTGPGSYTGLRIGIATALGLVRGTGAELRGEPSGEILAWRELAPGEEAAHVLDARQGEVYFARYRRGESEVEVLEAAGVLPIEETAARLREERLVLGDEGVFTLCGLDELRSTHLRPTDPPRAGALLELGSTRFESHGSQEPEQVEPLYLRPFRAKTRRR